MNPRHLTWQTICSLACLILPGCGNSTSNTSSDNEAQIQQPATPPPADERQPPADAAQAIRAVVDGFQQNRPEAIWEFLPPSHQQEINQLAREFAQRMDPELWRNTAAVARDSASLLKSRQREILSHPALQELPLIADGGLETKWDGFVALLETVAGSELADLEKMNAFDGREFFGRFDAEALGQIRELSILLGDDNPFSLLGDMLDGATVRQIEQSGDTAVVEIQPTDGKPRTFSFTRVEGRWIPASWASGLKRDIEQARARLEAELAPELLAQKKKLVMPHLSRAQEILDALRSADNDEAFHAAMTEQVIKPALAASSAARPDASSAVNLSDGTGRVVTIIVNRELTPARIDEIADALLGVSGADRDLTDNTADGHTHFVISPVEDVAAFAKTIRFGKVTQVDAAKRSIRVDVP